MAQPFPAVHRTILAVDVAKFGDWRRTNINQLVVRRGMWDALRTALGRAGIPWTACDWVDTGDGVLVLAPAAVPKSPFVECLPAELRDALRAHNDTHPAEESIRLRVALHAGEVNYDEHGVTSHAVNHVFRLLDARPVRKALANSRGVLALVASAWFYAEVVRHCPGGDPHRYRQVRVREKETNTTAWLIQPDQAAGPDALARPTMNVSR